MSLCKTTVIFLFLGIAFVRALPLDSSSNDACGAEASSNPLHHNPWLSYIEYYAHDKMALLRCAGTLIHPNYVLTAAHCIKSTRFTSLKVRLGEYDLNNKKDCVETNNATICAPSPLSIQVEKVVTHEKYSGLTHDIALLKLKKSAPYTDFIRPICLPKIERQLDAMVLLHSTGWGEVIDEKSSSVYAHIKKTINLPVWTTKNCKKIYDNQNLPDSIICAGGFKMDTCRGDSGGPLMLKIGGRTEILGVTSAGYPRCGTEGYPGVYTKVSDHLTWLRRMMEP